MSERKFWIELRSDHLLTESEIWPDGDAPQAPTPDDVAAAMAKSPTQRRMLRDWNMDEFVISVDGVEVDPW